MLKLPLWFALLCLWQVLSAQELSSVLESAREKLAAGATEDALNSLLAVHERVWPSPEMEELGDLLKQAGYQLENDGQPRLGLQAFSAALLVVRRRSAPEDSIKVAKLLSGQGRCYLALGKATEALEHCESALELFREAHANADHADCAIAMGNVAVSLRLLGRLAQAQVLLEQVLAMEERLYAGADNTNVATSLNNVAMGLYSLGRLTEALGVAERAHAMWTRLGGESHESTAIANNNVAWVLQNLHRYAEALHRHEAALDVLLKIHGERPHPHVASTRYNVARCLEGLGREAEALSIHEAALAERRLIYGGDTHPEIAHSLSSIGWCLHLLGRFDEAREMYEAEVAVTRGLCGGRDHPDFARALNNLANSRRTSGAFSEAVELHEQVLAMRSRIYGAVDHPYIASSLHSKASCLDLDGRTDKALPVFEDALSMYRRIYGAADHQHIVITLEGIATCLDKLGRGTEALPLATEAVEMIERMRETSRIPAALRQSLFDGLKRGGAFERLQAIAYRAGDAKQALMAAERSRGRDLLDLLSQQNSIDEQAALVAERQGDETAARRIRKLAEAVSTVELERDRLLRELVRLADSRLDETERATRRKTLREQSEAASEKHRRLLTQRAQELGDLLPVGGVSSCAAIQEALEDGELLLEFTITKDTALLFFVSKGGRVEVAELPQAHATIERTSPGLLASVSRSTQEMQRGRPARAGEPAGDAVANARSLFSSLMPTAVWERVRGSKRVFVAAHRALHRLPLELLVTDMHEGRPVYWLDSGPPISYVPSGSVLQWLRARPKSDAAKSLAMLVIGDPKLGGNVDGGSSPATSARRSGDEVSRLSSLPQLKGARAEAESIAAAFRGSDEAVELLLGDRAVEPAVFELSTKASFLHMACHGIAEEYAGQSLSMLVLAQPDDVTSGDDGFLKLGDLLSNWQGRLSSSRLVVLSACRTNVGPTNRDDAPQALPLGFLFAGAPSVVSSLWAVDDASTRDLMVDFYGRLLAGETDKLKAFTAAKKTLREKRPDPYYWAPFLFLGLPE